MPKKPNNQSSNQTRDQSSDPIIEGEAVEKDTPLKDQAGKSVPGQSVPSKNMKTPARANPMTTGLVMAGMVLGALIAAGGAGSYYAYSKYMMEDVPAGPSPAGPSPTDIRIADLETQLGSLTAAHQKLSAEMAVQMKANADTEKNEFVAGLPQILAGIADRLDKLEQATAHADTQDKLAQKDSANLPQADIDLLTTQTSVTVMSAVVSDNSAGRGLAHWVPVMDALIGHTTPDSMTQNWSKLRTLFLQTPPSQSILLANGYRFVLPMVDYTYDDAAKDDTIFGQALTSLGKLVQLRPVDQNRAGATGHLARFEAALAANDLRRAAELANNWPGSSIDGLDEWRALVQSRLDLDDGLAAALAHSITLFDARLQSGNGDGDG